MLARHLNTGNPTAAANAFLYWRRPASVIPRREAERDLFRYGRYPTDPIPVWGVDAHGRVDFSGPIRRLSEEEALTLLRPTPSEPIAPTGWLVRLAAILSRLFKRS